ncbi:MAG: hypothetical protein V1858_05370 [Candidatus Gottesmanbacteria bacterium]
MLIVTHFSPDLDAVTSVWLIKRYMPGWEKANVGFVPAGETWNNQPVDTDPDIIHVDTGLGKFDHHGGDEDTCAARLVLDSIKQEAVSRKQEDTLDRLVDVVNIIDHFREVYFPNPTADFYDFGLVGQLEGWKLIYDNEPERIVELSLECLDGVYKQLQNKVWAEKLLKEEGIEFETQWGKGIGIETHNDEVIHTGQKIGYVMVVRKDGKKGYVRIKSLPDQKFDLSDIYIKLKKTDTDATWFLHSSKHMILNGSTKNPKMRPTSLSLREIIDIIRINK